MKISFTFGYLPLVIFVLAEAESGIMYWNTFKELFPFVVKESILTDDGKESVDVPNFNCLI